MGQQKAREPGEHRVCEGSSALQQQARQACGRRAVSRSLRRGRSSAQAAHHPPLLVLQEKPEIWVLSQFKHGNSLKCSNPSPGHKAWHSLFSTHGLHGVDLKPFLCPVFSKCQGPGNLLIDLTCKARGFVWF